MISNLHSQDNLLLEIQDQASLSIPSQITIITHQFFSQEIHNLELVRVKEIIISTHSFYNIILSQEKNLVGKIQSLLICMETSHLLFHQNLISSSPNRNKIKKVKKRQMIKIMISIKKMSLLKKL